MKKVTKILFVAVIAVFINACEKDSFEVPNNSSTQYSKDGFKIKNGRLAFNTKADLTALFQCYADASDEELSKLIMPLYNQGFYSLIPPVTENNEEAVYNHYIELIQNDTSLERDGEENGDEPDPFAYLDELEDIIGDEAYAALLNSNGEIQVGEIIYKYTDVGLFFSKEDKYPEMLLYLNMKGISDDLKIPTDDSVKESYKNEIPDNGATPVNPDVTYFKHDVYACPDCPPGSSGPSNPGPFNPTQGGPINTDPSYNAFLNTLQSCAPQSGLFGNLFGDNNVCIDKYESKRRVKTKAFNYNYYLVFHLGVKCVHQFKGWTGFWRVEATNEVRLVVEAAQFEYNLEQLTGSTFINNDTRQRAYFLANQKILYQPNTIQANYWGNPVWSYQNQSALPKIFQDDLSFEFFGTGSTTVDNMLQNGIDNALEATYLNMAFYSTIYDAASSQINTAMNSNSYTPPKNRTFAAKYPENGKIMFQKSLVDKDYNIGLRKKTWDWGAEISINLSDDGEGAWSVGSAGSGGVIARPFHFRVKMIGAALHNGAWHGSKFNVGIY